MHRVLSADHGERLAALAFRQVRQQTNTRALSEAEAVSRLDDYLHHLRERHGEDAPSRSAREYLAGVAGAVLVAYALVVYPLIGYAVGQRYPATPTFGLPCPTTIFTFGVLLWATPRVPLRLLVIPTLWAMLGISAASSHGVAQDYGLPVAAVVACAVAVWSRGRFPAPHGSGSERLRLGV